MNRRRKGIITGLGATLRAVEIDYAIDHFLTRKAARGLRPNSLKAYGADCADLQAYLAGIGIGVMGLVAERHVEAWLDDMAGRGHSKRSIARRLSVVRSLFAHGMLEGWVSHDPTQASRVSYRATAKIAPEECAIVRMIDAIAPIGPKALRDRAMLSVIYCAALRVGEVIALDAPGRGACTVDLDAALIRVPDKGGGESVTALDTVTVQRVRDWLAVRDRMAKPTETALFVSARGGRYSRQGVHLMVKGRGVDAGLPGLHAHLLRHRRVGTVVEKLGIYAGKEAARHASGATTVAVYGNQLRAAVMTRIQSDVPIAWGGKAA